MKYYLSLLLCLSFSFAWAQQQEILQQYARQINSVQTLRSNFVEDKHMSLLDKPIQSQGVLAFDKNMQKLRWQYQKPFQNGFLIEKGEVYRLQGKEKNPVRSTMGRMFMAEMLVWLTLDFDSLKKDYNIEADGSTLTFSPRQEHKVVKKIIVWLDPKDTRVVTQVKMEEPSGDFIVWKFSNTQINPRLTAEEF